MIDNKLSGSVPSVYKAFKMLELISKSEDGWMGISEIQEKLGFPKSSVHSILNSMLEMGYVRKDNMSKKYGLGVRLHELGNAYRSHMKIADLFSTVAKEMREKCDETVYLAVLDGPDVVYLGINESSQPLRMAARVGTRLPAHITALGKVLLAQKSERDIAALYKDFEFYRLTETTITSVDDLLKELREIKDQGYAYDCHEQKPDVECFSAAVFNHENKAIAAISVAVPITRISEDRKDLLIKLVIEGAQKISASLGSKRK
jgi:DNA-binding IclR family transcriptional regulator